MEPVELVVTSFGPFLNVKRNPSQDVMRDVVELLQAAGPEASRIRVAGTHVVHVTPAAVDGTLEAITAEKGNKQQKQPQPHRIVLHLGVARGTWRPRLELVGIDDLHCPQGDADGRIANHEPIDRPDNDEDASNNASDIVHSSSADGDVSVRGPQTPLPPRRRWKTYDLRRHFDARALDALSFCEEAACFDYERAGIFQDCGGAAVAATQQQQQSPHLDMSYDAGAYLCNFALFRSMTSLAVPPPLRVAGIPRDRDGVNNANEEDGDVPDDDDDVAACTLPLFVHIAELDASSSATQALAIVRFLCGLVRGSRVFNPAASKRVALVQSPVDLPCHPDRRRLAHQLLASRVPADALRQIDPRRHVTEADVIAAASRVHSRAYLAALTSRERRAAGGHNDGAPEQQQQTTTPEAFMRNRELDPDEDDAEWGFTGDAAPYRGMARDSFAIAHGTLAAARAVASGSRRYAVHWEGGRHHAQYEAASGFCYVNDVAIAVNAITATEFGSKRVLVADFDAHHGDGTEYSCMGNANAFTLSMHVYRQGYFPGTGKPGRVAGARGGGLNIGLPPGAGDEHAVDLWRDALAAAVESFQPDVVVAVCGCDAVAGDPLGHLNLSVRGVAQLFVATMDLGLPMVCLGGGGYVDATAARCFSLFTELLVESADVDGSGGSVAVRQAVLPDSSSSTLSPAAADMDDREALLLRVPESCPAFAAFAPTFDMLGTPNRTQGCEATYASMLLQISRDAIASFRSGGGGDDDASTTSSESAHHHGDDGDDSSSAA